MRGGGGIPEAAAAAIAAMAAAKSIVDVEDGGFGFTHSDTTVEQMVSSIKRAATFFKDQKKFKKIRRQIMSIDHSWNRSASVYIQLYNSITN